MGLFSWFRSNDSTDMKLVTNSVDSGSIREVEENGDRIFVAEDVPFVRAQELAGGYVPAAHIRKSVADWDVPLTVNHPRNDSGDIVSANTQTGQTVTVGQTANASVDGEVVSADLRINADRAAGVGPDGAAIVDALENGDGIEVSSQYFADDLPPGVYDGEYRERVEGHLQPDSVALLPHTEGVCSLPDCGIAPEPGVTANADVDNKHLSVTAAPDDNRDEAGLVRRGLAYLGAAVSENEPATGEAAEPATANCECGCHESNESTADERAESRDGDSDSDNPTGNNMVEVDKETLISSISSQIDLDASTLQELDDDAIRVLYQSAVKGDNSSDGDSSDDGGGGGGEEMAPQQPPTGNTGAPDAIPDEVAAGEMTLDEYIDDRISSNSDDAEKEQMVDRIVANSAQLGADDRDDLLGTSQSVLEGMVADLDSGSPGLPGSTGTTANAATPTGGNDPDLDEFGTGVIAND